MAQRSDLTAQTFLFADLSGFTALTEAHGDEQAADLVGGFCVAVRQLLGAHQAQEVKTIGDALMLRSGDAAAAIQLGMCIMHDVGAQHGFPLVRVGMHTGPAVEREGDWFGATVNLAGRLSAAASGGDALLTATTRTAAGAPAVARPACGRRWRYGRVAGWRHPVGEGCISGLVKTLRHAMGPPGDRRRRRAAGAARRPVRRGGPRPSPRTADRPDPRPAAGPPGTHGDSPSRMPSMTVACLAMIAGLLLLHATSPATWRRRQLLVVTPPAAPVSTPPTPPPITLGVSRS
jgi:Adenylate and Guanylate cyclase catalytic domain